MPCASPAIRRWCKSFRSSSVKFFKVWKRLPAMIVVGIFQVFTICLDEKRNARDSSVVQLNCNKSVVSEASKMFTLNVVNTLRIEVLESPVVCAFDEKSYCVVRLRNGVTATVISDVKSELENDGRVNSFIDEMKRLASHNERCDDSRWLERRFSDTSSNDNSLAACAVTVKVGSFDDPDDIPGLCHLLEHVVSMGSEKFPGENAFEDLLQQAGGSYNAETDCDYTTFYFECEEHYFDKCLDMFSQFFKSPLLRLRSVYQEMSAVNTEFEGIMKNDNARRMQLICECANENNPARKFSWGNSQTLKFDVKITRLLRALNSLRKTHFVAENIHVAVQSSHSTRTMIKLVDKYFADMPTRSCKETKKRESGCRFNMLKFCRLYVVKSVADVCELNLNWVFKPLSSKYKIKPLSYLSYVIGAEGEGSLISQLRDEELALLISAGVDDGTLVSNSVYTIFTVCFTLTVNGYKKYQEVVKYFFGYVKMLKEFGPSRQVFDEMKTISKMHFMAAQRNQAIDNVKTVSRNMTTFPPHDYLTGWTLFFDYRPADIDKCLSKISPSNMNIFLQAKRLDTVLDKEEPWFKTKYRVDEISFELLQEWENVEPMKVFKPPKSNPYIATNYDLVPQTMCTSEPVLLEKTDLYEIWHNGDNTFRIPFTAIDILIKTTKENLNVQSMICRILFAKLLKYQIIEDLYFARLAFIEQNIAAVEQGLEISIFGLSEKLPGLLKVVAHGLLAFGEKFKNQESLFIHLKDAMKKNWVKTLSDGALLLEDFRKSLLTNAAFHCGNKFEKVGGISVKNVKEYWRSLFEAVRVVASVQGNITAGDALKIVKKFIFMLRMNSCDKKQLIRIKTSDIPIGETFVGIEAFHPKDDNCYTALYYQLGQGSEKEVVALQLFVALADGPLTEKIINKKRLGFKVTSFVSEIQGVLGIFVTVYSKVDQSTPEHVRTRVSALLLSCLRAIEILPNDDFITAKEALLAKKGQKPKLLKEEYLLNWWEIKTNQYKFDRNNLEISALKIIDKNFLYETACRIFRPNPPSDSSKKLVIQIVGYTEAERCYLKKSNYQSLASVVAEDKVVFGYVKSTEESTNLAAELVEENLLLSRPLK